MRKAFVLMAMVAMGCGSSNDNGGSATKTATPTFSPAGGSYTSAQSVSLSCATAGASIFYTTDGSTPTASSALYATPITVASTTTIKAIATSAGRTNSNIATATYTIGSSGGQTTFDALCSGANTTVTGLLTTCAKANPDLISSLGAQFGDAGLLDCTSTQRDITAGRITFDSAKGSACVSAYGALSCSDLAAGALPTACDQVLVGTVANGGACYVDDECAAGWCDASSTACPGTCVAFAQVNESCASATCAAGLECDGSVCKTPSAAGGACPCLGNLWCDTSNGAPGTCRATQTSGDCTPGSGACAYGHVCAGTPSTCQALVGLGGDCTAGSELCGLGYTCDATTLKCVSWPKLGEDCTSIPTCIGSYCDAAGTGKCLAYKALGAQCNWPADLLACAPGSTCDQATATCVAATSMSCEVP